MKKILLVAVAVAAIAGCTNTQVAHWQALGSNGHIVCSSGGHVILDDYSDGKIHNADGSDGYEFMSSETHRLTQSNGDCVIDYGAPKPAGFKAVLP